MAIHKVDGGYVISSHHVWMPGCYADVKAARYAFQFGDDVLVALRNRVNAPKDAGGEARKITVADLRSVRGTSPAPF